jgi:manganese-dependent inorganic pyrophosphatase
MASTLVTPRNNPDLDGVACAIAYAELLVETHHDAWAWIPGRPDAEARFVLEHVGWRPARTASFDGCRFVLVDASDVVGMAGEVAPPLVVEVIDHRMHHRAPELFPHARIQIEPVGAAATLIAERFVSAGIRPSARSALLLQAAIQSNTQRLRGSVTTDRDRAAAIRLQALCPLPDEIVEAQFRARAGEILADLPGAILREDKQFTHPDGVYHVSQLELPGAGQLIAECLEPLSRLGARAVLNLVDVSVPASYLVAPEPAFRAWLSARAGVTFVGAVSFIPGVLLRKQLVARIEEGAG